MTLEQAKALVPDKDYVVFNQNIYKFLYIEEKKFGSLSIEFIYLEINNEPVKVPPFKCLNLGEYRGSFTSDVLPPKAIEEDEQKEYSIDVFMNIDGELATGYFFYPEKKWVVYFDNHYFVDSDKKFKWIFKPDYLS